ncbi:MAG: DUF1963 domain-containing protein [Acidobacteria bacterium]|nr:DUF1963 domain-containing protein [Acidobacteriota bacterium]
MEAFNSCSPPPLPCQSLIVRPRNRVQHVTEYQIQTLIQSSGLGSIGDIWYGRRLSCVDFCSRLAIDIDPSDASRLGGPYLATPGFAPPRYEDVEMDFVCQIACSDVSSVAPHLRGHPLVFDASSELVPFTPSPGYYFRQVACILSPSVSCSLPSPMDTFQSPDTQPWHELDDALRSKFLSNYSATTRIPGDPYGYSLHRFMGHPDPIQYDWRPFLRGITNPGDWISLVAIYDDRAAEVGYGDTGCLYFWIERARFERGDFTKIRACIQTC